MTQYSTMTRSAHGLSTQIVDDARPVRPCTTRDPRMWDTGNEGNAYAVALCETKCPFLNECKRDTSPPIGVVRAGVAYDDASLPISICQCGRAMRRVNNIAIKCGHCRKSDAKPVVVRTIAKPSEHHDVIYRMLTGEQRYTYADVAQAIGSTRGAVKGYWQRWNSTRHIVHPIRRNHIPHGELVSQYLAMRAAGLTMKQVAARLHLSVETVRGALAKARDAGDERIPPATRGVRRAVAAA